MPPSTLISGGSHLIGIVPGVHAQPSFGCAQRRHSSVDSGSSSSQSGPSSQYLPQPSPSWSTHTNSSPASRSFDGFLVGGASSAPHPHALSMHAHTTSRAKLTHCICHLT